VTVEMVVAAAVVVLPVEKATVVPVTVAGMQL
jgi:hypothetical protein